MLRPPIMPSRDKGRAVEVDVNKRSSITGASTIMRRSW
jgi:hypothetical protein